MAMTEAQRDALRKFRAAQDAAGGVISRKLSADDAIRCRDIFRAWTPDDYTRKIGEVRVFGGSPYRVFVGHDSTANPGWTPTAAPALWTPFHGTSIETALPWREPTGAHDIYKTGEMMVWTDGKVMRAMTNTEFGPDAYPLAWAQAEAAPPPADYPAWKPWDGYNEHLYRVGDRVTHAGQAWESAADNNFWEPGVYGWVVVEEG